MVFGCKIPLGVSIQVLHGLSVVCVYIRVLQGLPSGLLEGLESVGSGLRVRILLCIQLECFRFMPRVYGPLQAFVLLHRCSWRFRGSVMTFFNFIGFR